MKIRILLAVASVLLAGLWCSPVQAQSGPGTQPVFTYVAEWGVPRAQWDEMEKRNAASKAVVDSLIADGTLIGSGTFENRIHTDEGYTHGSWFSASSVGNILKALEKIYSRPADVTSSVQAASKHHDYLMMATIHGAKTSTNATGYLRVVSAQIIPGKEAEFNATYTQYIKPVFDKLMAEGAILSYQLDTEFNVTNAPGRFFSALVIRDADAFDKVGMAVNEMFAKNPAVNHALTATTVPNSRNDILARITSYSHK